MAAAEPLPLSVGVLAVSAGSLLSAAHHYSAGTPVIPPSALGVLLLILAAILAYSGVRRIGGDVSLWVTFYWTVSALWSSSGILLLLEGHGVLAAGDMRNAAVPGLVGVFLALLIVGWVGVLHKEPVLALMALALSASIIHEIVSFYDQGLGSSATACTHLLVTLLGLYFMVGRFLWGSCGGRLPGTEVGSDKEAPPLGVLTSMSVVLNLVASAVFACRLLGVIDDLFVGQVAWLWVAAVYQTGICVLSYRAHCALHAMHCAFFSILRYAEGYSLLYDVLPTYPGPYLPFYVVFSVLFLTLALFTSIHSLAQGLHLLFYVAYCIALACSPSGFLHGGPQGVSVSIYVVSGVMLVMYVYTSPTRMPAGDGVIGKLFNRHLKLRPHAPRPLLGHSKYGDGEALAFTGSALAVFAMAVPVGAADPSGVVPVLVAAGGICNLIGGAVAFSRGKTLESSAFILYGVMWVIWGTSRYGGLYATSRGFNVSAGIACFLLFNAFIVGGALFLSKAWVVFSVTFQLILLSFLLDAAHALPWLYDLPVTIICGTVAFYCFLAALFNSTLEDPQIPLGAPFIRISGFSNDRSKCPHLPASRTSSVRQIADIMRHGGICGVPTDTVYVLVAACNQPQAVERAYRTKRQAEDRPMSLWISSLEQLRPASHLFSPLLWDFMEAAWPSSISLVIPRGPWLDVLGAQDSSRYIGTPESIAIRIPDCTVTTHLIDMVGPIAVTSANPSGEADTTHHNQVFAKLGDKVDGVLCDGASPENIASTVVNCTKLDTGDIAFFRVGIVPKSQVLQILRRVQEKQQRGGHLNVAFTPSSDDLTDPNGRSQEKTHLQEGDS